MEYVIAQNRNGRRKPSRFYVMELRKMNLRLLYGIPILVYLISLFYKSFAKPFPRGTVCFFSYGGVTDPLPRGNDALFS